MPAVIYFSQNGATRATAVAVAAAIEGELVELTEPTARKGFFGVIRSGFEARSHRASALNGDPWTPAAQHAEWWLLTPVWASNGTPAVNAFLERADASGKRVSIVTVQADPERRGVESVHSYLTDRIVAAGGTVVATHALHGAMLGKAPPTGHMEQQVAKLGIAGR